MCLQAFGFLNFFLWAGNIWFAYIETGLHKSFQHYPSRTPSEKRGSFRQYSQTSFDQSGAGFGQKALQSRQFRLIKRRLQLTPNQSRTTDVLLDRRGVPHPEVLSYLLMRCEREYECGAEKEKKRETLLFSQS